MFFNLNRIILGKIIYNINLISTNLKIHNTKCMSEREFRLFASDNHLEIIKINYFGAFVYNVHQKLNFIQQLIYKITRLIFKKLNPTIAAINNNFVFIIFCFFNY